MKKIFENLLQSLHNNPEGFSARKLSAFAGVITSIVATFKFTDHTNVDSIIITWLAFALLCLGIVTIEQIMKLKNPLP
jgi:hypothetical protein